MSLTLTVPDNIAQAAEQMARTSGSSTEVVLLKALEAHFPPVSPKLQDEFDAWNAASEEDGLLLPSKFSATGTL